MSQNEFNANLLPYLPVIQALAVGDELSLPGESLSIMNPDRKMSLLMFLENINKRLLFFLLTGRLDALVRPRIFLGAPLKNSVTFGTKLVAL